MKLTFLGTGTSMGVPVAGGFDKEYLDDDPRNIRWRCSAWVQTKESSIVIDTGPEFRLQSIRSGISNVDLVLLTHEHMDHISGLGDLRPFCYKQQQSIPVYSNERCLSAIRRQFDYMFGENRYPGATSVDLREMTKPFDFKDVSITPLPVEHGRIEVLGYRLNDLSYLTDVSGISELTKEMLLGSEVVVIDGLRWEPEHPSHLTIPQAVDIINELEIPEAYLIHMNASVNHRKTNEQLPAHIRLAFDQLTVEI